MAKCKLEGNLSTESKLSATLSSGSNMNGGMASTRYAKDYEKLINKPSINGVEVIGDKVSKDYKLQDELEIVSEQEIDKMLFD